MGVCTSRPNHHELIHGDLSGPPGCPNSPVVCPCIRLQEIHGEADRDQWKQYGEHVRDLQNHQGHTKVFGSTSLTTQPAQVCSSPVAADTCLTKTPSSAGEATSSSSKLTTQSREYSVSMRSLPAIILHTASKG